MTSVTRFGYTVTISDWTWCSAADWDNPHIFVTQDKEQAIGIAGWVEGEIFETRDGYIICRQGTMLDRHRHDGMIAEALYRIKQGAR